MLLQSSPYLTLFYNRDSNMFQGGGAVISFVTVFDFHNSSLKAKWKALLLKAWHWYVKALQPF